MERRRNPRRRRSLSPGPMGRIRTGVPSRSSSRRASGDSFGTRRGYRADVNATFPSAAQQLRLLCLELGFGEDAPVAEIGEARELFAGGRRGRRRRYRLGGPCPGLRLALTGLLLQRLLYQFGPPDVVERHR